MKLSQRLHTYQSVATRPFSATGMLWRHGRTLRHFAKRRKWRNLYNFIFTTYFVRGEDCGKGVLDPLWKFFPSLTPFLWDLEMEVTTRCGLRCVMCERTYFPADYAKQDTPFAQVKAIVDSLPRLKWINLTGEGSAFLNPEFMDMVRYVKSKGIYVDFSHDFHRIAEETMKELIELGVERIYVSLEGATKETYNSIRVGADLDNTLCNIKRFIVLKRKMGSPLPELCFRMSFFKDNWHEVEMMPDLICSLGRPEDLGDEPSLNIVGLLEFEQTKGWQIELPQDVVDRTNRRAKELGITVYWSHPSHDENRKAPLEWCTYWTEPYVMIGGYVVPCCAVLMSNRRPFLEGHSFGNVNGHSLREIWDSPVYREFRHLVVNPKGKVPIQCAGCRAFNTKDRMEKYGVENWGKV